MQLAHTTTPLRSASALLFSLAALAHPQEIGLQSPGSARTVSSASYSPTAGVAPGSIAATFGTDLATTTTSATSQPLPTTLAGTTVAIKDSEGKQQLCPLFFVSPGQVNHLIPDGTALGGATVTVTSGDGMVTTVSNVQIVVASLGLFTANATGDGPGSGYAVRYGSGEMTVITPLAIYDPILKRSVAQPIDLGTGADQTFITLFGTGLRAIPTTSFSSSLNAFARFPVTYVGPQGEFVGLDQINIGPILPSDATGAFENGYSDITMSLLALSESTVAQSNQVLFRIVHPDFAPIDEILTTDAGIRGKTFKQLTVWGDYFFPDAKVTFNPPDGLTLSNISIFDTRITFDLTVDAGTAIGDRQLIVTTSRGATQPLKFSLRDPASANPYLTNFVMGSNTLSFDFNSSSANLVTGSLLNTFLHEVDFVKDNSEICQNSYLSNALVHPGQTSGTIQYAFKPPLEDMFFSRHFAYVTFSVTDAAGRQSNTLGTRVDDPIFGCLSVPVDQ